MAYGAEVPFLRPAVMAQDESNVSEAHEYALQQYQKREKFIPDIVIVMSPTHPFRRKNIINDALRIGYERPEEYNLGSVAVADISAENFWIQNTDGVKSFDFDFPPDARERMLYRSAFSFNIVFYCRIKGPVAPRRVPIIINEIEAIDIDEPQDLELARAVVREGLYPFDE